jgi:succinyl-diaminopimelate desuccinylase
MTVRADLLALTAELVATESVSRNEQALADRVQSTLEDCPWLAVDRIGDNVIARTGLDRPQRIVIAGHLDTVPPSPDQHLRVEGDTLFGVGAADMKGALAVMLELATTVAEPAPDITWCFYACEEVERAANGLVHVFDVRPDLLTADAAVLGEPTAGLVEAGCQGSIRIGVELGGVRAHAARAHLGRNAIHRLVPLLERVADWPGRTVVLDGCEYVEQLQVLFVEGGVGTNVVPDRVSLMVNHRFAPDRDGEAALRFVGEMMAELLEPQLGDKVTVLDVAPSAPPNLEHPILCRLVEITGNAPRAKVGWTDVATFAEHGIPALNFGPGDPALAHHANEHVERTSLDAYLASLVTLLS